MGATFRFRALAALVLAASACACKKAQAPPPAPTPDPAAHAGDPLEGSPAPDFTLPAQDGATIHLAALKGRQVVVYFYPKDETPGCTKEACSFRDAWEAIASTKAVLVGVSADSLDDHRAFVAHHKLPFQLVSDPDGQIGRAYGVPFSGHHARQTFVIGTDGTVRKAYRKVDVSQHAQQILDSLTHG